jgi:hypothetical protein
VAKDGKKDSIDPMDKSTQVKKLTCDKYPQDSEHVSIIFGASVSARSVKLLVSNTTERDVWWEELRKEIEKNALSLDCTHILGYRESVEIFEDIMILSASGTAVKIKNRS